VRLVFLVLGLSACGVPALPGFEAVGGGEVRRIVETPVPVDAGPESGAPDAGLPDVLEMHTSIDLVGATVVGEVLLSSPGCAWLDAPDGTVWPDGGRITPSGTGFTVCTDEPRVRTTAPLTFRAGSDDVGVQRRTGAVGRYTSLLGWIEGCGAFTTCDPRSGLFVRQGFDVTHAPDELVLCPGRRTATAGRTQCRLEEPHPTYSGALVVAATGWQARQMTLAQVQVTRFDATPPRLDTLTDAELERALTWFQAALGPLPAGQALALAAAPMDWLGFEGPGLLLVNEDVSTVPGLAWPRPALHVVAHELAHQWAGNRATFRDAAEVSLKEALAEYLVWRFEQVEFPAQAEATRRAWRRSGRFALSWPSPRGSPPPLVTRMADGLSVGPMVLLQLEDLVGEAAVWQAVTQLLSQRRAIGWSDLQAELERTSQQDLGLFFEAWVRGEGEPEWPTVSASIQGDEVVVRQRASSGRRFPMKVELEVTVTGMTQPAFGSVRFEVDAFSFEERLRVPGATAVDVDPRQRVLLVPPVTPLLEPPPPTRWVF
jgi:aminopeptidase N